VKTSPIAQAPGKQEGAGKDAHPDANVTPGPAGEQQVLGREERVEYRDQDGNLLNEEQVASLEREGKVTFQTRYETKTRLVDADGRIIPDEEAEKLQGYAPEHPDVEGQNPETPNREGSGRGRPAIASESKDVKDKAGKPRPASEGNEATN
jgi:dolichyl-phosphate-mannose-protein mannosyltransferase